MFQKAVFRADADPFFLKSKGCGTHSSPVAVGFPLPLPYISPWEGAPESPALFLNLSRSCWCCSCSLKIAYKIYWHALYFFNIIFSLIPPPPPPMLSSKGTWAFLILGFHFGLVDYGFVYCFLSLWGSHTSLSCIWLLFEESPSLLLPWPRCWFLSLLFFVLLVAGKLLGFSDVFQHGAVVCRFWLWF